MAIFSVNPGLAQESTPSVPENSPNTSPEEVTPPANSSTDAPPASILSLQGGQKLMSEADAAINAQQYDVAADKLQKLVRFSTNYLIFIFSYLIAFQELTTVSLNRSAKSLRNGTNER